MAADYYSVLGINKGASEADIKSAYRRLAKQYHPDLYSNAPEQEKKKAEAKFKEVNQAYSVLSDPAKKSNYDRFGSEEGPPMGGFGGGGMNGGFWGGGGSFDDILSNIFSSFGGGGQSGPRQHSASRAVDGDDITFKLDLTFKEAVFGCEKLINIARTEECVACRGSGAKNGTEFHTCSKCGGTGSVRVTQQTAFGTMQSTRACDQCKGRGKVIRDGCPDCGAKGSIRRKREIKVVVPAGVDNGQMMTYYNEGEAGFNGGQKGNLIIMLSVRTHEVFGRKGADLYVTVPITYTQAALGCKLDVPALNEIVVCNVPENTQTGTVFRMKGKGIKILKKDAYGDLYVTVTIETPKALNSRQKELLINLDNGAGLHQYPKQKAFYDRLKNGI